MYSYGALALVLAIGHLPRAIAAPQAPCVPTATLTTTSNPTTPLTCNCPIETPCTSGAVSTVLPWPTVTTLTDSCTAVVQVGPPNCLQVCPQCVTPGSCATPTATTTTTLTGPACPCVPVVPGMCGPGSTVGVPPLPTATVVDAEGCVEVVQIGPGCGCEVCTAV